MGPTEARLYELVWQRTVASQMADAVGETVTVRLGAVAGSGRDAEFSTSGTVITFPGFQRAYVEATDEGADRATRSAASRPWPRATPSPCGPSCPRATRPARPPATPRRRW